ncbi:MAG: hypothetical protein ACRDRI_26030 [Pseudonocardiaceae bacterium]
MRQTPEVSSTGEPVDGTGHPPHYALRETVLTTPPRRNTPLHAQGSIPYHPYRRHPGSRAVMMTSATPMVR